MWSFAILAMLVESLHQQFGRGGGREVQTHNLKKTADYSKALNLVLNQTHLEVGQCSQRAKQRHGFAGAGRAAQRQRLVLRQPRVKQVLVPHRVDGGDNDVGRADLVCLHLNLKDKQGQTRSTSIIIWRTWGTLLCHICHSPCSVTS